MCRVKLGKVGSVVNGYQQYLSREDKKHQKRLSRRGLRRAWKTYLKKAKNSECEFVYPTKTSLRKVAKGFSL